MSRAGRQACILAMACAAAAAGAAESVTSPHRDDGFQRQDALAFSQAAIGRRLGDYTLQRAGGSPRRLADFMGKPLVISLVFTSCPHICPATTQHLRQAVNKARQALGDTSFQVLTIGFDWRRDTPEMMAQFARRQRVDVDGWEFLSGDPATIQALTADLGFLYYPAGGGFDHLIQSSVIDAEGRVYRQVYGIDFPVPHLIEPLKELVFETRPGQSLLAELGNRVRLFCTVYDPASDSYRFRYDIFVGVVIGLLLGSAALTAVAREWRRARSSGAQA